MASFFKKKTSVTDAKDEEEFPLPISPVYKENKSKFSLNDFEFKVTLGMFGFEPSLHSNKL